MFYLASLLFVLSLSCCSTVVSARKAWNLKNLESIVVFGDSYTDENRLNYFGTHDGQAPPVGWIAPESTSASSGGRIWARYAAIYTGSTLYNYAVSGAVCSNEITPRTWPTISAPFPSVLEYEVPAFIADSHYRPQGTPVLNLPRNSTVHALWVGTNDLGNNAFLTDSQVAGKTLTDYTDCIYCTLSALYQNGARSFVLLNLAPLELASQYATPANGGMAATQYWPDKAGNLTEISYRMKESVVTTNEVFAYRTPFETAIADSLPDASVALFDVNRLFRRIYEHPEMYLNGTAPPDVQGMVKRCDLSGANCSIASSPDSYLWYDPLHPSEQAHRIVAAAFAEVVRGQSDYAVYW